MPRIDILGQPGLIKPGDNITLKCSVVGGNPPPRLLWFLHRNLIGSNYTYDELTKVCYLYLNIPVCHKFAILFFFGYRQITDHSYSEFAYVPNIALV